MTEGSRPRPMFTKLDTPSRSAVVRNELEAAIMRGEYRPGDKLPSERELTETFGVSRVSVREAIQSLQAIGRVEVRRGQGCFVTEPRAGQGREGRRWLALHRDEALDLLRVRGALDELAAAEAAQRADARAVAAIRDAAAAFSDAAEEGGHATWELSELDVTFHVAVAHASGSELLANVMQDLHRHTADVSRALSYTPPDGAAQSRREHDAIARAIEAGDPRAAADAAASHVLRTRQIVASILDADGAFRARAAAPS